MAEFAAAPGAAGLVSLGLQVCSGLLTYCKTIKSRDKDLEAISVRLRGLFNVLEVLESVLTSSDLAQRPSFGVVEESILVCGDSIRDLEKVRDACRKVGTSSISTQFGRATYPFRRTEITSLNSTLNDLQSNLGLALQVAQRYAILI